MRCVHGEAMECVMFIGRQRNAWEPTSLDRTGDGNEAWRTTERRKQTSYGRNGGPVDWEGCGVPQNGGNEPPTVETGVLLIRRGVAYHKTDETDLLRSKRRSCLSGGVWRTAKQMKRTCVGALRSKRGSCSSGGVWHSTKRDSTGYYSSPPSTSSSLHGLLFIHR